MGIYFLVRDQKAYDQEQGHRRPYPRTHGRDSSYRYNSNSTFKSWPTRLAAFFRRDGSQNSQARPDTKRVKLKGSGDHGWVRAGSEDDWEISPVEERRQIVAQTPGVWDASALIPSASVFSAPSIIRATPVSRSNSDSNSSVRFDLGPSRGMASYDRLPSPHPTLPNIYSQLSSPSSSPVSTPRRVKSPEPVPRGASPDGSREFISLPSQRTPFPGGSKFIEAL